MARVILIGGAPFVGKSSVARRIAARYEYGCISTDDISKAVGSAMEAIGTATDPMAGIDWQDYFTQTPVEQLIEHDAASREKIWPAIEKIVQSHSTWDDPLVMEGYGLWPEQVKKAGFTSVGSIWLSCDDIVLESRIRLRPDFYRGAADEEKLISNVLQRSIRCNALMVKSAAACGTLVVDVENGHSINDIADLCVVALDDGNAKN